MALSAGRIELIKGLLGVAEWFDTAFVTYLLMVASVPVPKFIAKTEEFHDFDLDLLYADRYDVPMSTVDPCIAAAFCLHGEILMEGS